MQTCAWGGDNDSALVLHLTAAHSGCFPTMGSTPLPTCTSSRPRPPPPSAPLPPPALPPPGPVPAMCPVCGLLMHTSVLALRVCWGTYLASKGSGTRSSLVHFVIKEASDAGERPGLLMAAHFAMKEASDTDERVELLVAAAAALNLHGCASPSVSSREARARAPALLLGCL